MPLTPLPLRLEPARRRADAETLIKTANERIEDFIEAGKGHRIPRFIPSEFDLVFDALCELRPRFGRHRATFLEWGSGFGVVTGLAALLGFTCYGIEREKPLVQASRDLIADFDLPVTFAAGDYIPDCYGVVYDDDSHAVEVLPPDHPVAHPSGPAYEALKMFPGDADVIFVYPWPSEHEFVKALFEQAAKPDAILLLYLGIEEMQAWIKL
jgi:hypothetical protein